jgi:hypothetical protein
MSMAPRSTYDFAASNAQTAGSVGYVGKRAAFGSLKKSPLSCSRGSPWLAGGAQNGGDPILCQIGCKALITFIRDHLTWNCDDRIFRVEPTVRSCISNIVDGWSFFIKQ